MKHLGRKCCCILILLTSVVTVRAHDLPLSYLDLRLDRNKIEATVELPVKNLARDWPEFKEAELLDEAQLSQRKEEILAKINAGLTIISGATQLTPELFAVEPLSAQRNLRLRLEFPGLLGGAPLHLSCQLLASDPRHRTFVNIYENNVLRYQGIFDQGVTMIDYTPGDQQSTLRVVRQFLGEGIHHIFIGPDHILFIIGLLLLGGTIGQLLKIVTAFTIAHSITLVLATLNILSPPARLIEPAIALSIIFVGAHALLTERGKRDWRLFFAFGFGLIHGFGFANVLREMDLPTVALGWSLFSFNAGVEVGQACIVLAITPLLALTYRRSASAAAKLTAAAAFGVVFAGSYWFVERLFPLT